jgi:hypothetical protein
MELENTKYSLRFLSALCVLCGLLFYRKPANRQTGTQSRRDFIFSQVQFHYLEHRFALPALLQTIPSPLAA